MTTIKKALLIGINYTGTKDALYGCINDTKNLETFLVKNKYFAPSDLVFMNDTKRGTNLYPTKRNICAQLDELVKAANSDPLKRIDILVAYSGHGSNIRDVQGDELDGYDESLCSIDFRTAGPIIDDYIKFNFVDKLGPNVSLVMIVDACHSGTMVDLKYTYNCDLRNTYTVCGAASETKCSIISISGCMDSQTSADAYLNNQSQGAMTAAFINSYRDGMTYVDLICNMRKYLKENHFVQIPQLSSGKPIDTSSQTILSNYDHA